MEANKKTSPGESKPGWKRWLFLQAAVVIYTLSGVAGKYASSYPIVSLSFILLYGTEIFILCVYAVFWQQIIKKFDLSVAYANRSLALFWSMFWASILFKERVSIQNMVGVAIVVVGTIIVSGERNE